MRNLTRFSIVLAGSAALVGSMALPASAADALSGANDATVEITAGYLVLDTTNTELVLDHSGVSAEESTATGKLTGVNVSDLNSDGLGWTSTVVLNTLSNEAGTISLEGASYTAESIEAVGTVVTTTGDGTVVAPDGGNNTAVWNTTVTVKVPNTVTAGTYKGTLTHSLS